MDISNRQLEHKAESVSLSPSELALILNSIGAKAVVVDSSLEIVATNKSFEESPKGFELLENPSFRKELREFNVNSIQEYMHNGSYGAITLNFRFKKILVDHVLIEFEYRSNWQTELPVDNLEQSRFEALIEHAPEAILLWDYIEKRYIEANPNALKLFGYTKDELRDLHLGELSPEYQPDGSHSATTSAERIKAAMDGENEVFEWVIKRKNGDTLPCEVRVVRLPSKDKILMRSSIIDITERKKGEERLKNSEHRFRRLYDNTLFGVASVQLDYSITEVNPTLCEMLGYTREELLGLSLTDITHPDDIGKNIELFNKASKERSIENYQFEKRYVTKSGGICYGLISATYVPEGESGPYIVAAVQDITSSHTAQKNLKRSENQLRSFVKDNPIPVAMLDTEFNYIYTSSEWLRSFPSKSEELVGKNHLATHPNIPLRWGLSYQKALAGEKVSNERDFIIDENGETEWYRWEVNPWRDHDGSIGGIILFLENITEKVESETKLKEQEYMFHSVFDSSSIGWLVCDVSETRKRLLEWKRQGIDVNAEDFSDSQFSDFMPHFKILSYNRQTRDIFGFDDQQLITAKRLLTFFKDDYQQLFSKELKAMYNEESSFESEFVIENVHGVRSNIYLSVNYPMEDFNKVIYGLLDITDLRSSIFALRDSETRYRTMFDTNRLGVIYSNINNNIVRFNPAFQEMFGYSNQELVEMEENDILLPEYLQQSDSLYNDLAEGKIRNFQIEKQYRQKSGEILFANNSVTGLYDQRDQFYGSVTILEDVTQKKRNQIFIEKQNSELKKINAELDQFVYSAAHDLRAPIANVKGLIQLIRTEEVSDQALEYINLQDKSLEKLDVFINNIVNFSRNARLDLNLVDIDIVGLVEESIEHHRYSPNANRLTVCIDVEKPGKVITDVNRLNVVINNLVSNAIRYMDLNKTENKLNIEVRKEEDVFRFKFSDNGLGIRKEDHEKIFDLFYRAHQNSKGTGIGLYLVRDTVKKMGGDINVSSVEGESTTFEFTIVDQKQMVNR